MAANIFDQKDYNDMKGRIEGLRSDCRRHWGKMDINQMLAHCSNQLKLGLGKIEQSGSEGPFIMRTGFGRWLLLYVLPWTRGLPTPSRMNMAGKEISQEEFESERKLLLDLLQQVKDDPNLLPHPFFGELDKKDWGRLIWKHLDHHMKQFGG